MPPLSSPGRRLLVATVGTALLLTGCTQSPGAQMTYDSWPATSESPTSAHDPAAPGIPLSNYFTTIDAPLMDGHAVSTGEIGQPSADRTIVYDGAAGKPMALLSSNETVPVVGRAEGWIRVMLPSRRSLPGGPREPLHASVNSGTGWIKGADLNIQRVGARLRVSKTDRRLDVLSPAGDKVLISFPATVGTDVPLGPTYVAPGSGSADCGVAPIKLTAQSETAATYLGQTVSPMFIAGPSPECSYTAQDGAAMAPRMIQLSTEHAKELAKCTPPGTFIDVVFSNAPRTPETVAASFRTGASS
jgi:hypothetical protein